MKFQEKHKADADKFEVILVHNRHDGATDFATLDESIAKKMSRKKDAEGNWQRVPLVEAWGQELPFTIMLDTKGTTTKAWGVSGYPTQVLIDPKGNLVAVGEKASEEKLAEALEAAKKAADEE